MPCNILIYAANFIIIFDGLENHSVLGYVEYLTAFTYPFVFLNYCGNIELHLGKTIFLMGDMIFTHGRRNTCGCCHQRGYTVEFINKCTGLSLSIQCCSHNLASWEPVSRGYKRSGTFAESILYVFRLMLTCRNNCWSARNISFVFRGGIPDLNVVFNFLHHNDIISILYFVEVVVDSYTNVVG